MKVAYIIASLKQTGPNNVVYDLVQLMVEHGQQCVVYYFDDQGNLKFPCETKKIKLSHTIDFSQYDIVHAHTFRPVLYVFLHKPINCKTKFVATIHNYVFDDLKYVYGKIKGTMLSLLFLLLIRRQNKLITLSKDAKIYYQKWFSEKKLTYIYNTRIIDKSEKPTLSEKHDLESFKKDGVLIGVNSSIHERKGLDVLLAAMRQLPDRFKLYVVGDGPGLISLKQMCHQFDLDKRVRFCGRIHKAYKFLPYYDIYAIPSRSEGFPLSLLEAANYGCKVVCSDINVFKECFSEDEVIMFKVPNSNDLADAILKAEKNQTISQNIHKKFLKEYSPLRFYEKHMEVYSQVLNKS